MSFKNGSIPNSIGRKFTDKAVISSFVSVNLSYDKITIICADYDQYLKAVQGIATLKMFDVADDMLVKIYKKSKGAMNDNVNEAINEAAGAISGDFITDYVHTNDDSESTMNYSGIEAAKWHIKWLAKQGLQINIEERRYCYRYYIHYEGKAQYEALVKWLAWDFGYSETINNGCPKSERAGLDEIIKLGKWTSFK